MSRATEFAKECGFHIAVLNGIDGDEVIDSGGTVITDNIEAFYHAARAEALREAAERMDEVRVDPRPPVSAWAGGYETAMVDCADALRAMADREGK